MKVDGINVRYITQLLTLRNTLDNRIDEEINEEVLHQRGDSKKLVNSLLYKTEEDARFFMK